LKNKISIAMSLTLIICITACSNDETNISENNISESHNMGKNCMECHNTGGSGDGIFKTAGTVYDYNKTNPNPNGQIQLYNQAGGAGQLIATIKVDSKGNFYTTSNIDFTGGLYPVVISSKGNKKYMSDPTFKGECNSCHNNSDPKIWVD
jgi:hypothetical protein